MSSERNRRVYWQDFVRSRTSPMKRAFPRRSSSELTPGVVMNGQACSRVSIGPFMSLSIRAEHMVASMRNSLNKHIKKIREVTADVQRRLVSGEARDPHHAHNIAMCLELVNLELSRMKKDDENSSAILGLMCNLSAEFGVYFHLIQELLNS